MKTLHLSHTDIRSDSRILKEMISLSKNGYFVNGIGVQLNDGLKRADLDINTEILTVQLFARKLSFLPKTLKHILVFVEMMIKIIPPAILTKPIIVHCHDISVLPIAVIVKFFTKGKLIYDAHELESNRNGLTQLQCKLTFFIENILWQYIDHLIVVSPSIQKWYQETIGPKLSDVILNSPIISNEHQPSDDYLRKKFSIPKNCLIFIYVGILGKGRGLETTIEVFSDLEHSAHLILLGYGEFADQLKNNQFNNIHLHEPVPHAEVVGIIQSADYGLCLIENISLSDYYCLPNKLFEYCFAGVPVISSDFPDIRNLVAEYNIGICCGHDSHSLNRAILSLIKSQPKFVFKDLSILSWEEQEQKLLRLYQKLLPPLSITR
jgi:glycosyltransferase involved in cell wall biosynthesis